MLWLLSRPVEGGGLGFDPISARKLTVEAALFYLTSETEAKRRCLLENERSKPPNSRQTELEELRERKRKMREFYTGSAEMKW